MSTQAATSLGVPIKMPTDRKIIQKPVSSANLKQLPGVASSIPPSPRPATRTIPKGNHAQVVLLKRKRNEEPLDGLLLEMGGRNMSDLDLAKHTAENSEEDAGDEDDAKANASIRARKRKKLTSARGFFQLAETVEKAKWDDEAWRRDFNERVLTKSKEGKKALAAAAGVEMALDSPVMEKAQPVHPPSPAKPARKYTAVLQVRPKIEDISSQSKEKVKEQQATSSTLTVPTGSARGVNPDPSPSPSQSKIPDGEGVVYFNAVPLKPSYPGEKSAQEEEDEIAAFLPMLQDYLRLNDIAPAKITPNKKKETRGTSSAQTPISIHQRQESIASQSASDDEYVYDVYFKGNTEPTSSDWNNLGNYGTLVGLPPESKGDDDDSDDGADDSEYEDDDDSNAEEFYRNDYPDENDDHTDSDNSDEFYNDHDDPEDEVDYDDDTRWR